MDQTLYNISCSLVDNNWIYVYRILNSTLFFENQSSIELNSTSLFVGNFSQPSNNTLVFVFSDTNKNVTLVVSECVSLNGSLQILLNDRPNEGNSSFQLLSYNCSQSLNVSDSQIQVVSNYQNSECDKVNSYLNTQPNSLSISLSSSLDQNCKKKKNNLPIILGVVFGILGGSLIVFSAIYYKHWKVNREFDKQMEGLEMKESKKWKNNESHPEKTKWKEFESDIK